MRLLLDESVPRRLGTSFPADYEVRTVPQMGWAGTGNGALRPLAADHGFDALITVDRGIAYARKGVRRAQGSPGENTRLSRLDERGTSDSGHNSLVPDYPTFLDIGLERDATGHVRRTTWWVTSRPVLDRSLPSRKEAGVSGFGRTLL